MSNISKWTINQIDCYPESEGQKDVAFTAHWTYQMTSIVNDNEYVGSSYGSVGLAPYKSGEPFTPYSQLTEQTVIGWVKDALGDEQVAQIQENVSRQIDAQINPPSVTYPLPWVEAAA